MMKIPGRRGRSRKAALMVSVKSYTAKYALPNTIHIHTVPNTKEMTMMVPARRGRSTKAACIVSKVKSYTAKYTIPNTIYIYNVPNTKEMTMIVPARRGSSRKAARMVSVKSYTAASDKSLSVCQSCPASTPQDIRRNL